MKILVANIGSTSFKYKLFGTEPFAVLTQGSVERIGRPGGRSADYESAIQSCLTNIVGVDKALRDLHELDAFGFKAVHGGSLSGAQFINDKVLAAMEEFQFLAPAHNPPYLAAMRAFRKTLPRVPLVALFETAFFESLDEAATTYAVPYSWKQENGVRRYGFHGASHLAASERAQLLLKRKDLRLAGIAGGRGDIRDLSIAAESGDARARLALDVFVRAVRIYIGAFLITLGGADVLTFSGGIGENSALIREQVCKELAGFGIELDLQCNRSAVGEANVSLACSRVAVLILPADEEKIVARATAAVIENPTSR